MITLGMRVNKANAKELQLNIWSTAISRSRGESLEVTVKEGQGNGVFTMRQIQATRVL